MDLNMFDIGGLVVIEMVLEIVFDMCILILLMYDSFEYIVIVL